MARQYSVTGNVGNARRSEAIIRLCRRAIEIDPNYARAWALMASAQINSALSSWAGRATTALRRPSARSRSTRIWPRRTPRRREILRHNGRFDEALREIEIALRLDPESYDVNSAAGALVLRRCAASPRRFAISKRRPTIMETDYSAAGMLVSCYKAIGDKEGARRAAQTRARARARRSWRSSPTTDRRWGSSSGRSPRWARPSARRNGPSARCCSTRTTLNLRYNFACTLVADLARLRRRDRSARPEFENMRDRSPELGRGSIRISIPSAIIRASRPCSRPPKRASRNRSEPRPSDDSRRLVRHAHSARCRRRSGRAKARSSRGAAARRRGRRHCAVRHDG